MRAAVLSHLLTLIANCPPDRPFYTPLPHLVCFRGTNSWREVSRELRASRATHVHGKVHRGILELYSEMRDEVLSLHPRIVCGYSLGGALSILTSIDLDDRSMPPMYVVTFAAPRIGDRRFVRHYNRRLGSRTVNVVNDCDIIPNIPMRLGRVGTTLRFSNSTGSWIDRHNLDTYNAALESNRFDLDP